jgi:hypothetical protein
VNDARRDRTVHKARGFDEARRWDIEQHVSATHEERQATARELKRRVYGDGAPDVREAERLR